MSAPSPLLIETSPFLEGSTLVLDGSGLALVGSDASAPASFALQGEGPATPGAPSTGPATPGTAADGGANPGAKVPQGNPFQSVMMFALIGAVIWFLIFAPERKARKKREAMLGAVKKGDKVVTTGGLHAEVVEVKEHTIILKAGDSRLTFTRGSIHEIQQPKGEE